MPNLTIKVINANYFVTGGAGSIGSNIVENLVRKSDSARV